MENKLEAQNRGMFLPISLKASVEICNMVRNKPTKKAKEMLERVIKLKQPVPFIRYKGETPHRRGKIAEGRYPIKASHEILQLIKGVEANALNIGLSSNLFIKEIRASKGPQQFHHGRQRRIRMKRTHVVIKVAEMQGKKEQGLHKVDKGNVTSPRDFNISQSSKNLRLNAGSHYQGKK